MEPNSLRYNLNNFQPDPAKKEALLREYEYFASISPKSLFEKFFASHNLSLNRIGGFFQTYKPLKIALLILLSPLLLFLFFTLMPLLLLLLFASLIISRGGSSAEFKEYKYWSRIAQPTISLIDDSLELKYVTNSKDLVDEDMGYSDALEEAHMVEPIKKNGNTRYSGCCSYHWDDPTDPDSFEFQGYKYYSEWEDSDGQTQESISFIGSLYKFHLPYTIRGSVNIMSTKTNIGITGKEKEKNVFKPIKDKEFRVIDTENHEFAEWFDTIATFDEEAYRYLTPAKIETLLELRKQFFFCICLKGNVMTVAVDGGGYKGATRESIKTMKPYRASSDPKLEMDRNIASDYNCLVSILELRDLLVP